MPLTAIIYVSNQCLVHFLFKHVRLISMTVVEPKISDVVVKNITFFLVQPPERRSPKISGAGARETPFQGLFSPPVID